MPSKNLAGKDLSHANLDRTDLAGADLRDARLREVYARETDLAGADLRGADLTGADLRGASLDGAIVDGAALDGADLRDVDLTRVTVDPKANPRQTALNNRHSSPAGGPTRSAIKSVVVIKVEGEPCCVEILVDAVDRSVPTDQRFPGLAPMPNDHGLITLDLRSARALRDRLDGAVRVLEEHETRGPFANGTHPE